MEPAERTTRSRREALARAHEQARATPSPESPWGGVFGVLAFVLLIGCCPALAIYYASDAHIDWTSGAVGPVPVWGVVAGGALGGIGLLYVFFRHVGRAPG